MKLLKLLCVVALTAFVLPTPGQGQDSSTSFHVSPWIATAFFAGDLGDAFNEPDITIEKGSINNAPGFGLFAGVRLAGRVMVEGVFGYLPSTMLFRTVTDVGPLSQGYDLNMVIFGGNVGYAFTSSKTAVVPYVSGGAGGISFSPDDDAVAFAANAGSTVESTTEFMFNFGAGLEIPISDVSLLRLDLRDYIVSSQADFSLFPSSESSSLNSILFSGGITFRTR